MSFVRAAAFSTRAVRFQLGNASRRYSTAPPPEAKKPSNLPLYLGGAGIAGLAGYIYFTSGSKKAEVKQEKSPLDPNNFIDLELKRVEPYNHNTAKFILSLPDNQASLMPVASCVYLRPSEAAPNALKDDKGKLVQRPYTPVSLPDERGELTFLVKKYDEGKLSKYIHELKSGEKLSIKGPIMKFQYKSTQVLRASSSCYADGRLVQSTSLTRSAWSQAAVACKSPFCSLGSPTDCLPLALQCTRSSNMR
ncbi:hypothetical protein AcV7_001437 [Taiwanofungus camphoratus]|nr:hypothetical protein AcV7_001437 [Antrodia cinnamomea]